MTVSDPVSDYLTRIRNGLMSQREDVEIPASRLKKEMSRILKEQGYITDFGVEPTEVGEVPQPCGIVGAGGGKVLPVGAWFNRGLQDMKINKCPSF